jgi:Flp pilus assembly protein TadD
LSELTGLASGADIDLVRRGLSDPDPMVRIGALDMIEGVPADRAWSLVSPLLSDPVRGVRIRAASLLAGVATTSQPAADRDRFERAAAEFVAAQRLNADRPEARTALGAFYARRGLATAAESEFKSALRLSPQFAPAAINLADVYRQSGQDDRGAKALEAAIVASPQDAGLHHALGLALVRLKQVEQAIVQLRRAKELAPDEARYAYVFAVALHSVGRSEEALATLRDNLLRHPNDLDTLMALISFKRELGDFKSALEYAERLSQVMPGDAQLQSMIDALRQQIEPANR